MTGKTNDTNQKILTAAIQVIENQGEAALSLRQVANDLGVTTGAFYKHYANKSELLETVTKEVSHQVAEEVRGTLLTVKDPRKRLLALAEILLSKFQEHPNLMNFLFFNPIAQQTIQQSNGEYELLNITHQLIEQLLMTSNEVIDHQVFFIQIWSFIQGYGLLLKNKVVLYDRQLVETTLDALFTRGNNR